MSEVFIETLKGENPPSPSPSDLTYKKLHENKFDTKKEEEIGDNVPPQGYVFVTETSIKSQDEGPKTYFLVTWKYVDSNNETNVLSRIYHQNWFSSSKINLPELFTGLCYISLEPPTKRKK